MELRNFNKAQGKVLTLLWGNLMNQQGLWSGWKESLPCREGQQKWSQLHTWVHPPALKGS